MLRVAKLRIGGEAYYLEVSSPRQGGPGLEAPGEWAGSGLARFGLEGQVSGAQLGLILAGLDPLGARAAGQPRLGTRGEPARAGDCGERDYGARDMRDLATALGGARARVTVAGFDLTFAAPKSVSILHALGEQEVSSEVAAGHRSAVACALSYVERRAIAVRRRARGAAEILVTEGALGASFLHRTSRALDPHLHTHVLVANLGLGSDGGWSALDGRGIYAHAGAAEALYHAQLRHELTSRLGVAFEPPDRGRADVAGIGPEARLAFSRRSREIAVHLAGRGLSGPRAAEIASHATRAPREPGIGVEELLASWRQRALAAGIGPRQLESVLGRVPARMATALDRDGLDRDGLGHDGFGHDGFGREELAPAGRAVLASVLDEGIAVTRRALVRACAITMPPGTSARMVEAAAERVISDLAAIGAGRLPDTRSAPGREGHAAPTSTNLPGVGETRYRLEDLLERGGAGRRGLLGVNRDDLAELLLRRRVESLARDERGLGRGGTSPTPPRDAHRSAWSDDLGAARHPERELATRPPRARAQRRGRPRELEGPGDGGARLAGGVVRRARERDLGLER